jgi:hypothetical protein
MTDDRSAAHDDPATPHDDPAAAPDDRSSRAERAARDHRGRVAVRLLQGYVWHPRADAIDLGDYLPRQVGDDVHVLYDPLPAAPFTFFDDGTLSATQVVYQLTVLRFVEAGEDAATLLPWVSELIQRALERSPASVGWQILDDLRDLF